MLLELLSALMLLNHDVDMSFVIPTHESRSEYWPV